jgi:hypothetical protein
MYALLIVLTVAGGTAIELSPTIIGPFASEKECKSFEAANRAAISALMMKRPDYIGGCWPMLAAGTGEGKP